MTGRRLRHEEIAAAIRADITSGAIAKGDMLPSARTLTKTHEASLDTVQRALAALTAEGLVTGEPGRGVRVTGTPATDTGDMAQRVAALEAQLAEHLRDHP